MDDLSSPLCLAFALGIVARLVKSELALPKDLYTALSIYLLFALGLKGGVELSHTSLGEFLRPASSPWAWMFDTDQCVRGASIRLPIRNSRCCRYCRPLWFGLGRDIYCRPAFVASMDYPAEGFMPTLLTLLEIPGIQIALMIGAVLTARETSLESNHKPSDSDPRPRKMQAVIHEVLTARSMVLLVGGSY